MNWFSSWESGGISNLATKALKNAQKKIDKVLDIQDNLENNDAIVDSDFGNATVVADSKSRGTTSSSKIEDDFFAQWNLDNDRQQHSSPSHSALDRKLSPKKTSVAADTSNTRLLKKDSLEKADVISPASFPVELPSGPLLTPANELTSSLIGDWMSNSHCVNQFEVDVNLCKVEDEIGPIVPVQSETSTNASADDLAVVVARIPVDNDVTSETEILEDKVKLPYEDELPASAPSDDLELFLLQSERFNFSTNKASFENHALMSSSNEWSRTHYLSISSDASSLASAADSVVTVLNNNTHAAATNSNFGSNLSCRSELLESSSSLRTSSSELSMTLSKESSDNADTLLKSSSDAAVYSVDEEVLLPSIDDAAPLHCYETCTFEVEQPLVVLCPAASGQEISAAWSFASNSSFETFDCRENEVEMRQLTAPRHQTEGDTVSEVSSGGGAETGTSSDIEVISCSTGTGGNGGSGVGAMANFGAPYRPIAEHLYRCSSMDSENSDRTSAMFAQQMCSVPHLSPELHYFTRANDTSSNCMSAEEPDLWKRQHHHSVSGTSFVQSDDDNEMTTGADSEFYCLHPDRLLKKLAATAEILEARESKLIELSRENMEFREACEIYKNQLRQAEIAHQTEQTDLNALTEEFTSRIGEADKRFQAAVKEKENLKKQLVEMQTQLNQALAHAEAAIAAPNLERELREREEQVKQLLAEGERMAQEQLKTNTILKRLRAKEKDADVGLKAAQQRADAALADLAKCKVALTACEEEKRQHVDAVGQLTRVVQRQEKALEKNAHEIEEQKERVRSLQVNLDATFKELQDLRLGQATSASEAQAAALSAEAAAREELRNAHTEAEANLRRECDTLFAELEDLRSVLRRREREAARREEHWRHELEAAGEALSREEARLEELGNAAAQASRPLLRQLEALQESQREQAATWDHIQRQNEARMVESQRQLALAQQEERRAKELAAQYEAQHSAVMASMDTLKQEVVLIKVSAEAQSNRIVELSTALNTWQERARSADLFAEQLRLELSRSAQQVEAERALADVEARRVVQLHDKLVAAQAALEVALARKAHLPEDSAASPQSPMAVVSPTPINSSGALRRSVYDSMRSGSSAFVLEHLQSALKENEGDNVQLTQQLRDLERSRAAVIKDLADATAFGQKLQERVRELEAVSAQKLEMERRYEELLTMYGEQMELNNELRLDLQDVKEMYKVQIDMLLQGK